MNSFLLRWLWWLACRVQRRVRLPFLPPSTRRVALLIDGENCAATCALTTLKVAEQQGRLVVKRVYANWSRPGNQAWIEPVARYQLQPVHHERVSTAKNATDILLVVDAMDMLYNQSIDTFCLVTGDSDYTPLVKRLRKAGKEVIVIGDERTAESLKAVSSRFVSLKGEGVVGKTNNASIPPAIPTDQGELTTQTTPEPATADGYLPPTALQPAAHNSNSQHTGTPMVTSPPVQAPTRPLREAVVLLSKAILQATKRDAEGWVSVAVIGHELRKIDPTFRPNWFGHASLSKLVAHCSQKVSLFEIRTQHNNQLEVRLRRTQG